MCKEILVIEDEPQLARLVEMHLEDAGCRVTPVHLGSDGLDAELHGGSLVCESRIGRGTTFRFDLPAA